VGINVSYVGDGSSTARSVPSKAQMMVELSAASIEMQRADWMGDTSVESSEISTAKRRRRPVHKTVGELIETRIGSAR
jgi:hypothetical protein